MALGEVLGAAKSHGRHLMFAEIIFNGEPFEGGKRPHDEVDLIALHQLDGFGFRGRRHARSIGDDKFDLSARQREILVSQKAGDPFL